MKRFLSLLLASLLSLSLIACSASSGDFYAPEGNMNVLMPNGMVQGNEAENNQFEEIKENPFVAVTDQPISTFSADVDTASYTMLRKLIGMGYELNEIRSAVGKALRTEELLNYFTYEGALPQNGELFGVTPVIAPCPWNEENLLLTLTLKTEPVKERNANNLVFLIDVSGSMQSDDKLVLLQKSFSDLVLQLGEDDTVSIVTYSGAERVVLDGCAGNKKDTILRAIDRLTAGGSTNGEAGIEKAYEIAEKHFLKDGNNRIIMASDGDLNVGISNPDDLQELIETKRESGVYLSVLGFGYGNYHDTNMERLADCGNGVYYYIDGEEEAEKVFGTDLLSTLYSVAEDVKLQVTFHPEAISSYRLIGYENRLLSTEDFENDFKDAGEVGAGHSVTVCYELTPDENAEQTDAWMNLAVRYKDPGQPQSKEDSYVIGASALTEQTGSDFALCSGLIVLSMVIRQSEFLPEGWGMSQVLELLSGGASDIDPYRAGLLAMLADLE